MAERHTRTQTVRAGTPVSVGPITLLPIERVVTISGVGKTRAWFSVAKEPCALVVRGPHGMHAVDANAMAVSLAHLRETIPELDALLVRL